VAVSQTRAVPDSVLVAIARPSGLKLAQMTAASCRKGGSAGFPVVASQSWAVLSEEADKSQRSSGLKEETQQTPP